MQRIVFVGNCQVQAVYHLFQEFAWRRLEQSVTYIASYEEVDAAGAEAIAQADVILEQLFDVAPKAEIGNLNPHARRIPVPLVACHFLWPFAGSAHPYNPTPPYMPAGPFPAEFGMSFLNRMIRDGVDPEIAVDAFLAHDIPALDRVYELTIDRQRRRDELSGFGFADLIEANFRDERLFLTTYHPDRRIALALAAGCFERLDVDAADIERMHRVVRVTPFPKGELPIHPAVAQHFGLRYLPAEPRYRFMHEGKLTFREVALRYMRCDWNPPLEEGLAKLERNQPEAAEPLLAEAIAHNPDNAAAHAALGQVHNRLRRAEAAVAELQIALALDPSEAIIWAELAVARHAAGDLDGAEAAYREAIAVDPYNPHLIASLMHFLMGTGRTAAAAEVLRAGLEADDRSARLYIEMGHLGRHTGDWLGAADGFRRALALDPTLPVRAALADALTLAGRPAEAVATLRGLPPAGEVDAATLAAEARALQAAGNPEEAADLLRDAVARDPQNIDHQAAFGEALFRAGRFAEAVGAWQIVCDHRPGSQAAWGRLGEARLRLGQAQQAETAFWQALMLGENAHARLMLAGALGQQGRFADAAEHCRVLVSLEPSAPRYQALAQSLLRAGTLAEAVEAMQRAVDLAPENAHYRIELAHALQRAGRGSEAIDAAREAVVLAPKSRDAQANLTRMLAEADDAVVVAKAWEGAVSFG